MNSHKKLFRPFLLALASIISLLVLQFVWVYKSYILEHQQIMNNINDAFRIAYQKEQTYRIPVVDIVNPGEISIQSCGTEEIIIVRKCPENDTIVYNNISGHSIESFINQVFLDLREQIVPLNIHCLADLFAGMLHDMEMPVAFVIERFDKTTGEVLETSLLPEKKQPEIIHKNVIFSELSGKETIRAVLQLTHKHVFMRMRGILVQSLCLTIIMLLGIIYLYRRPYALHNGEKTLQTDRQTVHLQNATFNIGKYHFDPNKNELSGFGENIQLNKKENSILHTLCAKQGNVVERNLLLDENWGSLGMVYSRSLDTYLAILRKYLKKDPSVQIVTIKGVGYKLVF
jgi:DNA-binding response OmpR family regulator